jgi:hypothetical protein
MLPNGSRRRGRVKTAARARKKRKDAVDAL